MNAVVYTAPSCQACRQAAMEVVKCQNVQLVTNTRTS